MNDMVGVAHEKPFGVIDIGSNSVRLVLFDGVKRTPASFFNEKILCGLGRGLAETGKLDEKGRVRAIDSLARFRLIFDRAGLKKDSVVCFATSAVRDASDGADFIAEAEGILHHKIRVLTGLEEANLAAKGVLSGIPKMNGIIADLGGGSLELARIKEGVIAGAASYPFGPLRILHMPRNEVKSMLRKAFKVYEHPHKTNSLCLVGGAWRAMAKVHMVRRHYPLKVIHHYKLSPSEARDFADFFSRQKVENLAEVQELSERRAETIPYAALILRELIDAFEPKNVVVSAHGVREGVLYDLLEEEERHRDPFLDGALELGERNTPDMQVCKDVLRFVRPLFETLDIITPRHLEAACLMSNISWRDHPNYRRNNILHMVLHAPLDGISHENRIFVALCLYHRYGGEASRYADEAAQVVDLDVVKNARIVGGCLRFAHALTGQAPGFLRHCRLSMDDEKVLLELSPKVADLAGEVVLSYLNNFATLINRKVEVRELA